MDGMSFDHGEVMYVAKDSTGRRTTILISSSSSIRSVSSGTPCIHHHTEKNEYDYYQSDESLGKIGD
jgi:hypothetical protein